MKVMTKDRVYSDFARILDSTDAELLFIEEEPQRLYNLELMQDLMKSKGHNAHIIQLSLGGSIRINDYIDKLLLNYDSVSWINREHKFHIRRNSTALFN